MTIMEEIYAERARQDSKWGGHFHDDSHISAEWVEYIRHHAKRSINGKDDFRFQMVRVAALAVAAIESRDRLQAKLALLAEEAGR